MDDNDLSAYLFRGISLITNWARGVGWTGGLLCCKLIRCNLILSSTAWNLAEIPEILRCFVIQKKFTKDILKYSWLCIGSKVLMMDGSEIFDKWCVTLFCTSCTVNVILLYVEMGPLWPGDGNQTCRDLGNPIICIPWDKDMSRQTFRGSHNVKKEKKKSHRIC